jgi:hypothetical protein
MKDSLFIKICLIIIILLLGLNFLFSHSKSDSNPDRYSMYIDNELAGIFKLDKQTGQIWAITLTAEGIYPVGTMFELGTIKLKIRLYGIMQSRILLPKPFHLFYIFFYVWSNCFRQPNHIFQHLHCPSLFQK